MEQRDAAEDTVTDRVGQQFGNYQLVKLLGQGGCARVYLGKHRYLNSYAALKVLKATLNPEDEHTFLAEAQTLVDLRHPNIIHLLDFGIENDTPVLIMDYAPNGSLRQQYPDGTRMPLSTVVEIVTQIAAALQYAHNHNVIHRDVKPENILLAADNHLLLSDFGLSLLTPSSQSLSTQDPAGTPRYMAPEQLRGKPCFASDQYALAVMVYEWLCGRLPFRGTMWEIWQQHLYTVPPSLLTIRPELPPMLENVVLRALAKKPEDRFVSILAFAQALARASQTSTPVAENRTQTTDRLQPPQLPSPITAHHHAAVLSSQHSQIVQVSTRAQTLVATQQTSARVLQNQNRQRMLRRLRHSYSELMSQSLQGAAWLELGLASKLDAVQNVTNLLLRVSNRTEKLLPAGSSIIAAYDDAEHELLIVGEPGAGKSMLLLSLAQQLVERAEQDQTHPLPVILPLSSWAVKRPKLVDWIAEQLAEIYDIPYKLSLQWVQEDGILPLLDGLDEMEETARAACIAAINTYHRDHMAPLVVCSRTAEYEAAASSHRLILQGAVVIQPLAHEDVDAYLARASASLTTLRGALKKNTALRDLVTTPLMLNILILTYQGASLRDLSTRESLLLQQVWDDYVQRMVERKGNSKRYPLEQTRTFLGWQARQMRDHNQTLFYLEHLQPDWLSTRQQSTYAWPAVRLPAIFIGVLVSILVYLFFFGDNKGADLPASLQYATLGGFLGSLWRGPTSKKGQQGEHGHTWRRRLVTRLAISACFGLICGLGLSLHLSSSPQYTLSDRQTGPLLYGLAIGLSILLLQYFLTAPFRLDTFSSNRAIGRWKRLIRFFQVVQVPRALLVAIVMSLSYMLTIARFYDPRIGLRVGLSFGLIYGLISLSLSKHMEGIRPSERLRWSWRSLRRGFFNARHLWITLLLTCIITILVKLENWPSGGWLNYALSLGLCYWFLLGLSQGITQEQIEDQDRRIANQGIHRSLRNSVIMGLIGGGTIGCNEILRVGLAYLPNFGLGNSMNYTLNFDALSYGLLLGISGTLLIFLLTGGLAAMRHYTIRFLLWRSCTLPGHVRQFLDDATARFLLRRVGGGYSFTHRLLLDHLADAEAGAAYDANGLPMQQLHS